MRKLVLHEDYSREEVHDIFSPETNFTPQAGTWGLHGIVAIPDRLGDYVFFVTYGQRQGKHEFDEGITQEGVLSWQSQPRQDFNSPKIQEFINHDPLRNSVCLFLRTSGDKDYTYLGKLKYLSHDGERSNPVYFQWQILDWNIPQNVLDRMELKFQESEVPPNVPQPTIQPGRIISVTPRPERITNGGKTTREFRGRKQPDYAERDATNRTLGLAGEKLVLKYERDRLIDAGYKELAEKILHISQIEGDGTGYDIKSYSKDGSVKYIEVKTTRGGPHTAFYMSVNEVEFSDKHHNNYHLYRVYEYDRGTDTGKLYSISGSIRDLYELSPITFRVR